MRRRRKFAGTAASGSFWLCILDHCCLIGFATKNQSDAILDFWKSNACLSDAVSHRKSPENAGGETPENWEISKLPKSRLKIIERFRFVFLLSF